MTSWPMARRLPSRMLLGPLVVLTLLTIGFASPSRAADHKSPYCTVLHGAGIPSTCLEFTGRWPDGKVRATGSAAFAQVVLQRCGTDNPANCGWQTVASGKHVAATPWVKTTKFGWFRACSQWIGGSGYIKCQMVPTYLGD